MTIFGRGGTTKEKLSPGSANPSGASKPTALVDAVTAPQKGFGIRSYLHQFYQSPTVEDIESAGAWYLLPPPPAQRTGLYICRLLTVVGLLLLIGGAASIVVGYTWPHETAEETIFQFALHQREDGTFEMPREKINEMFKDPMRRWKTVGVCVFAGGAVILAFSLLIPTCSQCFRSKRLAGFISEDGTPNEPPIRIYPSGLAKTDPHHTPAKLKISPTSGPVPVMEEIAKVQPTEGKTVESAASADDLLLGDTEHN